MVMECEIKYYTSRLCRSVANGPRGAMVWSMEGLLCFQALQERGQLTAQGNDLVYGKVHFFHQRVGDGGRLFLQGFSCGGEVHIHHTLVLLVALAVQELLFFQAFKQRGEGTTVQVEALSQFFYAAAILLPKQHQHEVLGVGKVQCVQGRPVHASDLPGKGVDGETEVIFQF